MPSWVIMPSDEFADVACINKDIINHGENLVRKADIHKLAPARMML